MAAEASPPAAAAEPPAPPPAPSAAAASAPPSSSPAAAAPLGRSPYPFAYAPDIIRSHQKDAYFQGVLTNQLADLHRNLLGARSAHGWAAELRTFADLLYLSLTTLIGNRTLGEEYCGLVQVESETGGSRLPDIRRRAGYIAGSILLPYGLSKVLPALRSRVRKMLERNLERLRSGGGKAESKRKSTTTKQGGGGESSMSYRLQSYILANLSSITSPAPVHAVSLALFYFSGSYYEMAKRFVGLRYIFTHKVGESSDRAGYEVLGVLLVIQMLVQGYLHVQSNLLPQSSSSSSSRERSGSGEVAGDIHVSLEEHAYSSNNSLLMAGAGTGIGSGSAADQQTMRIGLATSTPIVAEGDGAARHDLSDPETMRWIKGAQQRKCTLCLEELKDPSATSCGHVFCWVCIGDWVREKPECPLCRREAMVQHILPLRAC